MSNNFQSHFGLISTEEVCRTSSGKSEWSFNPILVWFQLELEPLTLFRETIYFQSHFGLISTRLIVGRQLQILGIFQSHFGLISTAYKVRCLFNWKILSIPFWSDFNLFSPLNDPFFAVYLSIPFWSDFNRNIVRDKVNRLSDFQSHFGLISTKVSPEFEGKMYRAFNPIWSDFNIKCIW